MKKGMIFLLVVVLLINGVVAQEHVPGEVIVKYKEGVVGWGNKVIIDKEIVRYNVEEPVSEEKIVNGVELYNLKFGEGIDVLEVVEEYEGISEVEYAEPNFIMISDAVPNDTSYDSLYWTENINAEAAWDLGVGNKEVIIAILDTGVDWDHPDLAANIINRSDGCDASLDLDGNGYFGDCRGYDFTDINVTNYINAGYSLADGEDYNLTDNDPMDFDGHGTHVSGIASAVGNNGVGVVGSCWNCSIMPVRSGFNIITGSGASVGSLEIDDVASAIYYAADNDADIISMSFGGGDSSTVRNAVEYAYGKGSILVASSGNAGTNTKQYPCGYEEVICVGSTNSDNSPASYSNYGDWVGLVAPGTSIYSTGFDDGYVSLSGTSMSTPMVAGMIGVVKGLFDVNGSQVLSALQTTGTDVNFSGTLIKRADLHAAILSLDNINPVVSLDGPVNNLSNQELDQTFVCSATDWQLSNIELRIWNSSGLFYNSSSAVSGESNSSSFDVTLGVGNYDWNCLVSDVGGNGGYASENYSISTLNGVTQVSLDSPDENYYTNSNPNIFNCSVEMKDGRNLVDLSFNVFDSNGSIHRADVNSSPASFSYNFSEEGSYHWNCESLDDQGEIVISDNRSLNYDVGEPTISLSSPADGQSYDSNSIELDFEFEVSELSSCSFVVGGSVQETKNNVLNSSFSKEFSPDDYTWNINCSDLAGNLGVSETRGFTVEAVEDSGSSGGGGGGGGGSSSSSSSTITPTTPTTTTPAVEEVVEKTLDEILAEEIESRAGEENLETDETTETQSGITGFAVEGKGFSISDLQKHKNRVNVFVIFLLAVIAVLFYRDFRYEKDINKEIEILEK